MATVRNTAGIIEAEEVYGGPQIGTLYKWEHDCGTTNYVANTLGGVEVYHCCNCGEAEDVEIGV